MSDCPRLGRFLNGCQFEARYENLPISLSAEQTKAMDELVYREDALDALKTLAGERYVGEACTRCGKINERSQQ